MIFRPRMMRFRPGYSLRSRGLTICTAVAAVASTCWAIAPAVRAMVSRIGVTVGGKAREIAARSAWSPTVPAAKAAGSSPTASAPAATARRASPSEAMPQILRRMRGMAGGPDYLHARVPSVDALAGIGAPKVAFLHPAIEAIAIDAAPIGAAALDVGEHAVL